MLDKEKDQGDRPEVTEAKAAPEVQRSGVIGDAGNQARWNRAQQAHYLGQDESATDLFRKPGDTAKSTGKFELFDNKAEAEPDPIVAWDPREQLKEWGDGANKFGRQTKQKAAEVSAELTKDGSLLDKPSHPYKDNPDQLMDYNACRKAWNSFPALKQHANLDPAILPAIIRNEVRSLRADDQLLWNPLAEHGYDYSQRKITTIGPANMMVNHIDRLIQKYPQLTDPQLGGIDPKHACRDAIKPEKAAWLAAAYLADEAEKMEKSGHKNITHHDLIKSYNPAANQDDQFKRIHNQLIEIKQRHPLYHDD